PHLLQQGHGGLFFKAVARIEADSPASAAMLRALARGRGRGLPESGRIWVTVARALAPQLDISDDAARRAIELAAPYITLDGEGGQSTYRLAHQTFVEHLKLASFEDDLLDSNEVAIGDALLG